MRRAAVGMAVGLAVLVLAALAWSEPLNPKIRVHFTHPVIVNSQTLSPGTYVLQEVRGPGVPPVFRVTDAQGTNLTLTGVAIHARVPQSASDYTPPAATDTEVVLQKIGGQYYLDKIWIQGRTRGWDFEIPDSVKSQASNMQQEIVNGSYEQENQQASDNQSQSSADNSQSANTNGSQMNSTTSSGTASTATSSNSSATTPQQTTSAATPQQQTYSAIGPTPYSSPEHTGTAAPSGQSHQNVSASTMSNDSAQPAASGSMSATVKSLP